MQKDEIKEKMTIGKAKKILRGFLAKDCYYDTPLYYAIPYLLDYITNLQEKYERMKENAETLSNGYNELEQRNEKAIEYMKKWGEEPDADMYMQMKQYKEFQYLLNILQNGEQNWEWIPVYNTTNSEGE